MTPYDPELTMEANARVLADELFSDGVKQEVSIWREKLLEEYMLAAYQDGYDEARAHWLAGVEIPEVPDEP